MTAPRIDMNAIWEIAEKAHAGQLDKSGDLYTNHLREVSNALMPFGLVAQAAGVLHDILEDTDVTEADLLNSGVPQRVVDIVKIVSRDKSTTYQEWVREVICQDYDAALVKLADNAHNSDIARFKDPSIKVHPMHDRYFRARQSLLNVVSKDDARLIFHTINPDLLKELD